MVDLNVPADPVETLVTRVGRWLLRGAILSAAVALGIVIAIVTIILPRKHDLAQRNRESAFFAAFHPTADIERVTSQVPDVLQQSEDRDLSGSRLWFRSYVFRITIPQAEQGAAFERLLGAIQAGASRLSISSSGRLRTQIWTTKRGSRVGDGWRHEYGTIVYRDRLSSGAVDITATGHGDEMVLHVSIAEH